MVIPISFLNTAYSIYDRGTYGIDKIKLFLNQSLLNHPLLRETQWHDDALDRTIIHTLKSNKFVMIEKVSCFYLLIINQEFFNHSCEAPYNNILLQVYFALHLLALEGFIPIQPNFQLYLQFIKHITELEIYFSLKKNHFSVIKEQCFDSIDKAKENKGFFQYKETDTYYSYNDYKRSSVCLYNKKEKDHNDDNLYKRPDVMNYPYPYRLEYRLRYRDVADISLLNAPLKTVFTNYLPVIVRLTKLYVQNNMSFNIPKKDKYNRVLKKL